MSTTIGLKKGYFITFEGSDGAGKSTQIDLLRQALQSHGFKVYMTREPGGCKISEQIRDIVKNPKNKKLCPESELLLMNAARAQLVREVIQPELEAGKIVICDRFYHSTIVYQGFGRGLDQQFIKATIQFAIEGVVPDVTFVLHLDKGEAAKRANKRKANDTRFEEEDDNFRDRVAQGMNWLKDQEQSSSGRIVSINADNTKENLANEIYRCCVARIGTLREGQLDIEPEKRILDINAQPIT
jgi:dTMP kinase